MSGHSFVKTHSGRFLTAGTARWTSDILGLGVTQDTHTIKGGRSMYSAGPSNADVDNRQKIAFAHGCLAGPVVRN